MRYLKEFVSGLLQLWICLSPSLRLPKPTTTTTIFLIQLNKRCDSVVQRLECYEAPVGVFNVA
ncbi:MAG: hypothetical protein LH647_24190, partial [Leptolyngbyaceae cyanobacterium CAN_BIN12]|nr:hypothetical protein [Leptolyngbyaceae cyanobacterium CAN_BIN12]